MTFDHWLGAVLSVLLSAYLIRSLIRADRP